MTTIAFDGEILAADTQMYCGNFKCQDPVTKIKVVEGIAYAITGYVAWFDAWIQWYKSGSNPHHTPMCSFNDDNQGNLIVVQKDGTGFIYSKAMPYPARIGKLDAWGSGSEFAIGAMMHGATAIEAVEIAIKANSGTDGNVISIKLEDL